MVDVSAVIVNYNAGSFLKESVFSLIACPLEIEVIVVDNASSDGSLDAIGGIPAVTIIRNEVNLGFSAGCNVGLNETNADNVLFLNPDCVVTPGSIVQLLSYMQAHEHVGMVGGLLVDSNGVEQAGCRRLVPTPWRTLVRVTGLTSLFNRWPHVFEDFDLHKQPLPMEPIEVEAISGACMLVKREAIERVGSWDEGYFLHCEDLDWCMRFRQKGWKIALVPTVEIVHALGACSKTRPIFVEWHKHKGMARFYNKFFKQKYAYPVMLLMMLGIGCRFLLLAAYLTGRRITFAIRKAMSVS
jgi:GT2 family glycosyltransferase